MPQGLITLLMNAARLYVSAYFRPLLKIVTQKITAVFIRSR